jgi:hypothetical protein
VKLMSFGALNLWHKLNDLKLALTHLKTTIQAGMGYSDEQIDGFLALKAELEHNHDSLYYKQSQIATLLAGKSDVSHNHDADYSDIEHNHDADYSDIAHDHDLVYAPIEHTHPYSYDDHTHDDIYTRSTDIVTALAGKSDTTHNHDGNYSALGHDHDSEYSDISHNHDADYSDIAHNHDSEYSDISHNHDSEYAEISHEHNQLEDTGDIYLKPDSASGYYKRLSQYYTYDDVAEWNNGASTSDEKGVLGRDQGTTRRPYREIYSFTVITDDGGVGSYSHVDDLQLLRDVKEWDVREKALVSDFPEITQKVFDKETLPWIVAHSGVSNLSIENNDKRYMSSVNQKIGYLLSTMKKILVRQDEIMLRLAALE